MLFYLTGPDTFRAREKLREIKEKFRREVDPTGSSIVTIDGTTLGINDLGSIFGASDLFAPRRCMIIENITKNKTKELSLAAKNRLEKSDVSESKTGNLIIFFESEEPAAKNPLHLWLVKNAYHQGFAELERRAVTKWITDAFVKRNRQIEDRAVRLLIERTDGDLWQLSHEIEKIDARLDMKQVVDVATVEELTTPEDNVEIFPLVDAIVHGDAARSAPLLLSYLSQGESPQALIALLETQLRVLVALTSSGGRAPSGTHPFVVKKMTPLARNFSAVRAKQMYQELGELDMELKTSGIDAKTGLLNFVMQLAVRASK